MREDKYVQAGPLLTRYWEEGSGLPLVLIHGLGDSCHIWERNLEALGRLGRAVAVDMPGFGLSERPRRVTVEVFIQWLDDLLTALEEPKALLVGHSLGGLLCLLYYFARPHRVAGLALVASAGLGREVALPLRLLTLPLVGELLARRSLPWVRRAYQAVVYDPTCITEELVAQAHRYLSQPGAKRHLLRVARLGGMSLRGLPRRFLFARRCAEIALPTLLVWGQQDRVLPVKHALDAHRSIPRSRLVVYDPCGHIPQWERPEAFNQALASFFLEEVVSAEASLL